jgi:hypothetical protein
VRVPHPLYSRLEERAKQTQRSVEEELVEALAEAVSRADDPLPGEAADVLASLDTMPNDALWQLARTSQLSPAPRARHGVSTTYVPAVLRELVARQAGCCRHIHCACYLAAAWSHLAPSRSRYGGRSIR